MIHVVAKINVGEGQRDALVALFKDVVAEVRAEQGCIEYVPTIDAAADMDGQATDGCAVTVIEKWESIEALKAHLATPHMGAFFGQAEPMIQGIDLQVLEDAC